MMDFFVPLQHGRIGVQCWTESAFVIALSRFEGVCDFPVFKESLRCEENFVTVSTLVLTVRSLVFFHQSLVIESVFTKFAFVADVSFLKCFSCRPVDVVFSTSVWDVGELFLSV